MIEELSTMHFKQEIIEDFKKDVRFLSQGNSTFKLELLENL